MMRKNIKSKLLDNGKNDDQEDAELHDRKGPEFDGAKCNGSEYNQKNENEFDEMVDHNDSSKFKAESSKENIKQLKAQS